MFGPFTQQMLTLGHTGGSVGGHIPIISITSGRNSAITSRKTASFPDPSAPNTGLPNTHTHMHTQKLVVGLACATSFSHLV